MAGAIIKYTGDYSKTKSWLEKLRGDWIRKHLDKYGKKGVEALSQATPIRTGKTAASWEYTIETGPGYSKIVWSNTNVVNDWANIAILLQMGHGTRNGGYVQGRDYINPALRPIFDKLVKDAWKEVTES